jgi:hypothetical protein
VPLPPDPHARRVVVRRAARLAALSGHASFEELQKEADRKEEREKKSIVARMMSPEGYNQRDVDYWRGFINGMKYLCALPGAADATVQLAAKEEEARTEVIRSGRE